VHPTAAVTAAVAAAAAAAAPDGSSRLLKPDLSRVP